jgi:dihydrolipoamide dehydrogenase
MLSTQFDTDVAIIGAGTAGLAAYHAIQPSGKRTLIIEGGAYGTTCARSGCMPSKLLIAAAEAAHHARNTDPFGVHVEGIKVDGAAVMARVQRERDRFVGSVLESIESFPKANCLTAKVRFQDASTLITADNQLIRAQCIVIASGSSPVLPPILKGLSTRLLTSDSVFELPVLPKSLAVFGSGPLGMELAQAMSRLQVSVKVFGKGGGIAGLRDEAIRAYANKAFNEEFYLDASAQVKSVTETATGVEVHYLHRNGNWQTEHFEYVLAATGRVPNVAELGLEKTGLQLDKHGVPLFDRFTLQCGNSSIFIAGDASNEIPLLHEAADQGRIAGGNAGNYPNVRTGLRRAALAIVFTEPQVASVGLNLDQIHERFQDTCTVGEVSFEDQGRSRVILRNKGMLKVYGELGSGLLLGAEMFGPAAEHIGHLLAWAVQERMTISKMLDMPFYHPVIEEGLRSALRDLNHKLHIGPAPIQRSMDCGPES